VDQLPLPKPSTKVSQRVYYWLAMLDGQQRILLQKRPPAGIWGGLWTLPEAQSMQELEQHCGLDLSGAQALAQRHHRLSHVAMSIYPIVVCSPAALQVVSSKQPMIAESAQQGWFGLTIDQLPAIPQPLAVLLSEIRDQLHE
jgi:A/G-specific adenine glycosylase